MPGCFQKHGPQHPNFFRRTKQFDPPAKVGPILRPNMKPTASQWKATVKPGQIVMRPVILETAVFASLVVFGCGSALADSPGSDWSSSYGFPGSAKHQTNMTQADLIAKREAGYYDGLGKTEVYNITTTSIGTMTTSTTTISGNENNVMAESLNSGGLDAGVLVQSLQGSSVSQNKTY
jgi:hypothetical protein